MDEIRDWLQLHDDSLTAIAERLGLETGSVRAAAALVLEGWTDDDIVEAIRNQIVAMDSQEHPVRNVPQMVFEVRRVLADADADEERP
jgi:hypothetical protein